MDTLRDKSYREYDYTSRYANVPYYYDTLCDKYVSGITAWLDESIEYITHHVSEGDTLDKLALNYYGRPDLFWVIADFNRITDCFVDINKEYKDLKIPNIVALRFKQ